MTCNTPLQPLLDLTNGWIGPIWSISWSCQTLAPICFILTILLNLHFQQIPNPYLLGARRWWLRVKCVERIGIWPVLRIGSGSKTCSQLEYTGHISLFQSRQMGLPFGSFPTQVGLHDGWWSAGPAKNIEDIWLLQIKTLNEICQN